MKKKDQEAEMLQDQILHWCKFSIRKWLEMNSTDGKPWLRPVAQPSGCHSMKYSCMFFLQLLSYFNWHVHVRPWLRLLLHLSRKQLCCHILQPVCTKHTCTKPSHGLKLVSSHRQIIHIGLGTENRNRNSLPRTHINSIWLSTHT